MASEMKTMEVEVAVEQPAWLVWQAHVKNFQIALPASVPGHFKAVQYLEGPPLAPGGVFKVCYEEGFEHYDYVTFKWIDIDHEKFRFKATVIDGGVLGKHFHDLHYNHEMLPGADENSCIVKWKLDYRDIAEHDFHSVLQDELRVFATNLHGHINTLKNA